MIQLLVLLLMLHQAFADVQSAPSDMFNKEIVTRLFSLLTPSCQQELERFILKHIPFGQQCQVEIAKSLEVMKVPIENQQAPPKTQLTDEQQLLGMKYFLSFCIIVLLFLLIVCVCGYRCFRSRLERSKRKD